MKPPVKSFSSRRCSRSKAFGRRMAAEIETGLILDEKNGIPGPAGCLSNPVAVGRRERLQRRPLAASSR